MEQYIKKSALIAEMKKEIKYIYAGREYVSIPSNEENIIRGIQKVEDIINTLEVKEVDLEKHLKKDIEDTLFDLNGVAVIGATHYLTVDDVKEIAKHFFELGLNAAQKGE